MEYEMKVKRFLQVSVFAALVSVGGISFADNHGMMRNATTSQGMQGEGVQSPMMGQPGMVGQPGMMGGIYPMAGMGAMGGMMSGCPMMGSAATVLSPQQQLQMHAEMMQAMGKIMEKYAAQAESGTN
jgi:hypothetical protein